MQLSVNGWTDNLLTRAATYTLTYALGSIPFKDYLGGGLPWWLSGKESACQCKRHGCDPWSEMILHAAEQLSPGSTTTELVSRAGEPQLRSPPRWEAHAPKQRVVTAHCNQGNRLQQRRPSTAINKQIKGGNDIYF